MLWWNLKKVMNELMLQTSMNYTNVRGEWVKIPPHDREAENVKQKKLLNHGMYSRSGTFLLNE